MPFAAAVAVSATALFLSLPALGALPPESGPASLPASPPAPASAPAPGPASAPAPGPASAPAPETVPGASAADFDALLGAGASASGGAGGGSFAAGLRAFLPNISAVGMFYAAWMSGEPTPRFGHDPAHTGFGLQELELAIQSVVDPYFRADVFFATNIDEFEIEEAYLSTLADIPLGLSFRLGSFLTRFGRLNPRHLEIWSFADQPLPYRRFIGGEGLRDLGLEASMLLPLPIYLEAIVAAQHAGNEGSFGGAEPLFGDAALGIAWSGRLALSFGGVDDPFGGVLGLSAVTGPNAAGSLATVERSWLFGVDFFMRLRARTGLRWVDLTAEYLLRTAQVPGALVVEAGLYAEVAWRVSRRWELALRGDFVGLPGFVGYDASRDPGPYAPADEGRGTAAVTFYTSEFMRLRLQYGLGFLEGRPDGNPYHEAILTVKFNVGPHGAHPF